MNGVQVVICLDMAINGTGMLAIVTTIAKLVVWSERLDGQTLAVHDATKLSSCVGGQIAGSH
jgi:hypothetical protein